MGGDFGHFLASAEVDGKGSGMFGEECWEPNAKFVGIGVTESCFDGDGKVGSGFCGAEAFNGEVGGADHGGTTTGSVDVAVGAAHIEIDPGETEFFEVAGNDSKMLGVLTPNLSDDWRVGGGNSKTLEGVHAPTFGSIARNVSELSKEEVGTAGAGDNLAENKIRYALHGREAGEIIG